MTKYDHQRYIKEQDENVDSINNQKKKNTNSNLKQSKNSETHNNIASKETVIRNTKGGYRKRRLSTLKNNKLLETETDDDVCEYILI